MSWVRRRWLSNPSSTAVRPHSQTTTTKSTAERSGAAHARREEWRLEDQVVHDLVRRSGELGEIAQQVLARGEQVAEGQARDTGDPRRPGPGHDGGRCGRIPTVARLGGRARAGPRLPSVQPAGCGDHDAVSCVGEHRGQVDGDVGAGGLVARRRDQDGGAARAVRGRLVETAFVPDHPLDVGRQLAIGLRAFGVGVARDLHAVPSLCVARRRGWDLGDDGQPERVLGAIPGLDPPTEPLGDPRHGDGMGTAIDLLHPRGPDRAIQSRGPDMHADANRGRSFPRWSRPMRS